jgi:hypothetical protein
MVDIHVPSLSITRGIESRKTNHERQRPSVAAMLTTMKPTGSEMVTPVANSRVVIKRGVTGLSPTTVANNPECGNGYTMGVRKIQKL